MGSLIERYLDAASTYATDIDGLITLVAILVGFWGVLAEIVLIGLVIAYREKPGAAAPSTSPARRSTRRRGSRTRTTSCWCATC